MGYECKCGKLGDFNVLLCGVGVECFVSIVGDFIVLCGVIYVIMLDLDIELLCDVVWCFVSVMVYLFNCLVYDVMLGCVVCGYGIL